MTVEMMYDELVNYGVSKDFIDGAVCMGGWNEETMERVLFYNFGFRSFEQLYEEE